MIRRFFYYVYCFLHSVRINFMSFPIMTAIHFPILMGRNVKLIHTHKGAIELQNPITPGMIKIGIDHAMIPQDGTYGFINIARNGHIAFEGKANFNGATSIICNEQAIIRFGKNFSSNQGCEFFSDLCIQFGDDVLIGWNCTFHDGDGHTVLNNGVISNPPKEIIIGSHVWIAAGCDFLKGSIISDGSVVAKRSLITSEFQTPHQLIGGHPARTLRNGIDWER